MDEFFASGLYGHDLLAERFFAIYPVPSQTVRREQIISDSEWDGSVEFNEFVRQGGLDLGIVSQWVFGGGQRSNSVVLYLPFGAAPLPERARWLGRRTQRGLGPLLGTAVAAAGDPGWSTLPPRWRQMLDCLLDGDSEKQAAARLGISPQTVHQYVKGLYAHFGVSSRGELLAFFLRRHGCARPWTETEHPPTRNGDAPR